MIKMERNVSLDLLRIFACLTVIMIHTAGSPIVHGLVEIGTLEYDECLILEALSRWSVPVFAMLTGFFMLDSTKDISIKTIFSKYILRLFISLVFWSAFYAVTLHKSFYPLGCQEGHFWYVGMCIGLYLALPIMRLVASNTRVLAYFCWTWLAIKMYQFLGVYFRLPVDLRDIIFVDYVGYCLFAYYLKVIYINKFVRKIFYIVGILSLVITIIAGLFTKNCDTAFYGYTAPNVIIFAISLFIFFLYHPIKNNNIIAKKISIVSQCTFGIYMVHLWILIQIFFRFYRFVPYIIPLCLICVCVTFFIALGMTYVIRKIPYVGRYIV